MEGEDNILLNLVKTIDSGSSSPQINQKVHRTEILCSYFNNGIDRASLLTEPAVDTLGHIDVISCRSPAPVRSSLCLNSDSLGRADGLTKLTSYASLLPIGVAPQGMLPSETGADWSLLERVIYGGWFTEEGTECHSQSTEELCEEEGGCVSVHDTLSIH